MSPLSQEDFSCGQVLRDLGRALPFRLCGQCEALAGSDPQSRQGLSSFKLL